MARGKAVEFSGGWKSDSWVSAGIGRAHVPSSLDRVELPEEQITAIAAMTAHLRNPAVQEALGIPLRRFQEIPLRANDADRLIDLMIAAEAFFLPKENLELGHKMALRAAMYVTTGEMTASDVFRFMKSAYSARSRLVHGKQLPKLTRLDGSVGTVSEVVGDLEVVLAEALTRGVAGIASEVGLPKWDEELGNLLDGLITE